MPDTLLTILADMTGQEVACSSDLEASAKRVLTGSGMGYSQFNELLLLLGYDRISERFFEYLANGNSSGDQRSAFKSLEDIRAGTDRFRKLAMLRFGNVKFAFKYLSTPSTDLEAELEVVAPVDDEEFSSRHDPLVPVDPIPAKETYLLGYLVKRELDERLQRNPDDTNAKELLAARDRVIEKGRRNHEAYLATDHMDVYVATSMRERHEFQVVNRVIRDVFSSPKVNALKLRPFDPTQAYCEDRIDKGLAEALMLKRAACTLYLAQESDTLGKDSELACTLAQGKPVIAYIPVVSEANSAQYVDELLDMVANGIPDIDERKLILQQLRVFGSELAWCDSTVRAWVADSNKMDVSLAKKRLGDLIRTHYDQRAKTLKASHPLGIQVHLETGVANGVLVARTTDECAELIYRILTRTLDFRICEKRVGNYRYLLLKESTTDSVFRVVTGDRFLTNAFWNFYLSD